MEGLLVEGARELIKTYGLPGVVILALAFWGWSREKALTECQKVLREDAKLYAKELRELSMSVTRSNENQARVTEDRTRTVQDLSATMVEVSGALKQLVATNDVQVNRVLERLDVLGRHVDRRPS